MKNDIHSRDLTQFRRRHTLRLACLGVAAALLYLGGCPRGADPNPNGFENSTDKSNAGAKFVGSSACVQCHADVAALHAQHGHAQILKEAQGAPPVYPAEAPRAGVPAPPPSKLWTDVAFVVGGYRKAARFVNQAGYVLTTAETGADTQWNLSFSPNGTIAGFAPFEPNAAQSMPYDFACFQCHTTGPAFDPSEPRNQDGREGIVGTWNETGVQCESCHGPGGGHFRTEAGSVVVDTARVFVDPDGSQTCAQCHNRPFDDRSGEILARDGYIQSQAQWPELRASGGHSRFACTICHDPHRSLAVDRAAAMRNNCTGCHAGKSMAGHAGKVYRRGEFTETLTCESCHMPYATRNAHNASEATIGPLGRMGDTRTHIFRINTAPTNYEGMLTDDGERVLRDEFGRAAVTVDFVCLRCHNGGGLFRLTVARAAEIGARVHELP